MWKRGLVHWLHQHWSASACAQVVLASVDADADGQNEDSEETKKEEGVDQNCFPICFEVAKFHSPGVPRKLKQEARGEQYEEQQPYQNRRPIHHFSSCNARHWKLNSPSNNQDFGFKIAKYGTL